MKGGKKKKIKLRLVNKGFEKEKFFLAKLQLCRVGRVGTLHSNPFLCLRLSSDWLRAAG